MTETKKVPKAINLTPRVIDCLKSANMSAERITALYFMRRLDLLKDIDGITDNTVYKLRVLLSPDEPTPQNYSWVYQLALSVFFGEFDLNTLLYAEPNSIPLIDRVIIATRGTEDVALNYLRMALKPSERELIVEIFRDHNSISDIAKRRRLTEVRVRQIYHQAMEKLGDEDKGIADDLLGLVFSGSDDEKRTDLTVISGDAARLA